MCKPSETGHTHSHFFPTCSVGYALSPALLCVLAQPWGQPLLMVTRPGLTRLTKLSVKPDPMSSLGLCASFPCDPSISAPGGQTRLTSPSEIGSNWRAMPAIRPSLNPRDPSLQIHSDLAEHSELVWGVGDLAEQPRSS